MHTRCAHTHTRAPCCVQGNQEWEEDSAGEVHVAGGAGTKLCISACTAGTPPPPPPPSFGLPVVLNGSRVAHRYDGVWAMSANGAARLLYEYPEATRSQILDLLFSPAMGTYWQGLKVEIGGDVESSYGSMSSYAHVQDPTKHSFQRGVQFWLIKEAKRRNPTIPLYALSWYESMTLEKTPTLQPTLRFPFPHLFIQNKPTL